MHPQQSTSLSSWYNYSIKSFLHILNFTFYTGFLQKFGAFLILRPLGKQNILKHPVVPRDTCWECISGEHGKGTPAHTYICDKGKWADKHSGDGLSSLTIYAGFFSAIVKKGKKNTINQKEKRKHCELINTELFPYDSS